MSISNMLRGGAVLPQLKDGMYKAEVMNVTVVDNEKGGYINVELKLNDEHQRGVTWTVFPSNVQYFFGNVARQLGHGDTVVTYFELINEMKGKTLDIYTSWNAQYNNRNYSFSSPTVRESLSAEELAEVNSALEAL